MLSYPFSLNQCATKQKNDYRSMWRGIALNICGIAVCGDEYDSPRGTS